MTRPARIQYRRGVKGWRLPAGAKVVHRGSRWGNPFPVDDFTGPNPLGQSLDAYTAWLNGTGPDVIRCGKKNFDRRWQLAHLADIAGRDLACTCKPGHRCHGDELIRPANPEGAA